MLLFLTAAAIGCSSHRLSVEEQQQLDVLYKESRAASPREKRLIDCRIRSIEHAHDSEDVIQLGKNKNGQPTDDPNRDCAIELEKTKMPQEQKDQQEIENVIDRNLKNAVERSNK